ncbi:hypothetical protein NTD86_15990 [Pseudomonas sp. 7P_10.2_Bac1]|uniref:hypothetical protein n=1 Tax=Pseudomonas sp. 7P_10.2_Bac1 TaxID=2971614 RepID=UPI0021C6435D|nr:hypothetical protein [Pseudomonas sp. 7P_10.2_Bac1]MCU1728487.1 hypothetical protein [Pseudomonas sp. 7P_10.2_Bac1]
MPLIPAVALLPQPTTDPAPLANIDGGETNLLARAAWSDPLNPLKVKFEPWENSKPSEDDPEQIQIFLGTLEIGKKVWTEPIDTNDLFVAIEADKLQNGEHKLNYLVTIWSQTTQSSESFTITIDKSPPQLATPSTLIFPSEISPPNSISAAYLDDPANNNQVVATLPDYTDKKVGDVITWYWDTSPSGQQVVDTKTLVLADLSLPLQVAYPGDLLRRANGDFYASYRVRDRAGNGDDVLANPQLLKVNIRPPTPRKYPTVKEASSSNEHGVLAPFQGADGVTVVVAVTEVDPGEEVLVDFIGAAGPGSVSGVKPTTAGGLEFAIPPSVVAANIPVSGLGNAVEVRYWVGQDAYPSQVYTLTINAFAAGVLGSIHCRQAQVGSPATLAKKDVPSAGANLEIRKWAYQAPDQLIKVWAVTSGNESYFLDAVAQGADGTFETFLPKSYVDSLPLNAIMTLHASISFDEGKQYFAFKTEALKIIA